MVYYLPLLKLMFLLKTSKTQKTFNITFSVMGFIMIKCSIMPNIFIFIMKEQNYVIIIVVVIHVWQILELHLCTGYIFYFQCTSVCNCFYLRNSTLHFYNKSNFEIQRRLIMLIALFNAIVKIYEVSKLKKNYHYWWIVQLFILCI